MNKLDWFQARALARDGIAVRRETWTKWLSFESYVWLITQPAWQEQTYARRVVQQWEFGSDEFFAKDWTDEPWSDGPQPPDPPNPPNPPKPPRPPYLPQPPGNDGGGDSGGNGTGGNGGGSGNPPTDPPAPPGGNGGTGGTGWPPGGGGGGPQPPVPPAPPGPPQPPAGNAPTITVEVFIDINPDGPLCFVEPPATCTAYVNVSIASGPAGVGTLGVSGPGTPSPQLGTAHPGFSGGFEFTNVPVNPGATITYSADYGAPGAAPLTHYVAEGAYTFPPLCLMFDANWHGNMTEDKTCEHAGPSGNTEDGYHYTAAYSINGRYAVNPADGTGKTARLAPVDVNEGEPHIHWTNDTIPAGTHTEGDIPLFPPGAVTIDVAAGTVSNLRPESLNVFGSSQHHETQDPHCTFDRTTDEQSTI